VKKLKYLCAAFVLAAMLGLPAAAQKGRANTGAHKQTGQARAEEVQATNKKGDKDPSPSKGSKSKGKKTRTREGWEKKAKHNGGKK
jgi:hypothetical protein